MKVFLSAVQAGNRSGTGRYTEELITALLARGDVDLTVESEYPWPGAGHVWSRRMSRLIGPGGGYDVMHYPANFCPLLGTRNTAVTVHDLSFLRHPEWFSAERARYYRAAFTITRCRARRIIADSHATKRDLIEIARVPEDKIDVAHLGVSPGFRRADAAAIADVRERYKLPEHFFLYVGTLEPRKNLPRLLAAYDQAATELPQQLVIAGRAGWKVAGIQQALAVMQHSTRVHFPGFVEDADLPAVLSAAEGFVWPSLFEGFGLPPLEALACGVPVLTSHTSSLPELFAGHALLVDPASTADIALGLLHLAAQGGQATPAAVAHAQSFTWAKTADAVLGSYRLFS